MSSGNPPTDGGLAESIQKQSDPDLRTYQRALQEGAEQLRRAFEQGQPVAELVAARARQVDEALQQAWGRFFEPPTQDATLVAVGGYGRGELHPHSDIDLMILLVDDANGRFDSAIEQFLMFLWDIGLEVGHSVRTLSESVREASDDITVATNLMEARCLAGSASLFEAMRKTTGPDRIWPSDRFFEAKWAEQQRRHHKFDDTAYNLEPNIKEGPGGLRDIQMIGWVAKRHFGAETLPDLVGHGFLTPTECQSLIEHQNFLWAVRFALHTLTGRREDRLLFDYQQRLALMFDYSDGEGNLAVEQFMQRYYRTIKELARLNEMLLQLFQEAILYAHDPSEPVAINERFQSRKGFLEVTRPRTFETDPIALLELFLIMEQHPDLKGVRASTIRLVRDHTDLIDDRFRKDPRAHELFMEILRQPYGINQELHRMSRYGVLGAYLPAFAEIVGRMQYDLFHVYTVDEHSLFVVRNLRRFLIPEHQHEYPLCSELMRTAPKPDLLYLAGLFHDIAKGRGGDHSDLGAEEAWNFCIEHGVDREDAELVSWLVKHHLIMSITAQRRDISDPEVINEFAAQIGDKRHLDHLYLLTVADIRATNPALWNSWKDALLLELYSATRYALERGLEKPIDSEEPIHDNQQTARSLLEDAGMDPARIDALWQNPNREYFLYHSAEEIAWHTEGIAKTRPEDLPLVLVKPQRQRGSTAIFIYGPHIENQFALTTSALEQLGLTIVDARIVESGNEYTLDTFMVLEETGEPIENEHRLREIRETLKKRLEEPARSEATVSRRPPRRLKHFEIPTRVTFEQDPHNQRSVMKVTTADRPGLLSRIGKAFAECHIGLHAARASTIGAEAEDVFYITDDTGQRLTRDEEFSRLREAIERHLSS